MQTALELVPEIQPDQASIHVLDAEDKYLASIPEDRLTAVFASNEGLEPIITAIEGMVRGHTLTTTTAKGRAEVRALAHKVTRSKTYLDDIGKGLVAELKDLPKRIDANRKAMRDRLDILAEETRQPLTDYEQRIEAHQGRLKLIADMPVNHLAATAPQLEKAIQTLAEMPMSAETWEEFHTQAAELKARILPQLEEMYQAKVKANAEAAELERLRKESAERDRQDSIRRAQEETRAKAERDADERSRLEREAAAHRETEARRREEDARRQADEAKQRLEETQRLSAERDRQYAEQKARDLEAARIREEQAAKDAAQAERDRAERETREAQEAEAKRKADEDHFRAINREVLADVEAAIAGLNTEDIARAVVRAIVKGQIRHTTIAY